jgi:F-type H+-transporting ATPase subunit epsilon
VSFVLHLESAGRYERIDGVESFVGTDASGQFGLLAGHERFVTVLLPSLARFRLAGEPWQYLALAGGVAYFIADALHVSTLRYARDPDYRRMQAVLDEQLRSEQAALAELRTSVRRLDEEMRHRLYELERSRAA